MGEGRREHLWFWPGALLYDEYVHDARQHQGCGEGERPPYASLAATSCVSRDSFNEEKGGSHNLLQVLSRQ